MDVLGPWAQALLRPPIGAVGYLATWLQRAMLVALAAANLAVVGPVVISHPRISALLMSSMHVLLTVILVVALRWRIPYRACLMLGYAVWLVDDLAVKSTNDSLALGACWLGYLVVLATAIGLRSRTRIWLPIVGAGAVALIAATVSPLWDVATVMIFPLAAAGVVIGAALAMPPLWRLAATFDRNLARLESERREAALIELTSAAAAEDIRVVHDTVINTLGAVANGGSGRDQESGVRSRCLNDVAVIEGLLNGRRHSSTRRLEDSIQYRGNIHVDRTGLSDVDLTELNDLLAPDVASALLGAVREAIRNAEKHADVDRVAVHSARTDNGLLVEVSDRGVGISAFSAPGHGLRESIIRRIEAVGGAVSIRSSVGQGTEIAISRPLQVTPKPTADAVRELGGVRNLTHKLLLRGCWLSSICIVGIGVVLNAISRPDHSTWAYGTLALVSLCIAASYLAVRDHSTLPTPVALLLSTSLPLAYLASLAGIGFGRGHVLGYYAVGIAPLLPILISTAAWGWSLAAGSLLLATAVTTAVIVGADSPQYAAIVITTAMPTLGLGIGWWLLQQWVPVIVKRSEKIRQRARKASLDASAQQEISQARQRWGTASLHRAAALLHGIGHAELDLDQAVRDACAVEEQYLRQFLLLNPRSFRMNAWFAHALAAARARDITLTIRSGDSDAPDDFSANLVGGTLLDAVAAAPNGAHIVVSWFPTAKGPRLGIVGPQSSRARTERDLPSSWTMGRTQLGDQELLELVIT